MRDTHLKLGPLIDNKVNVEYNIKLKTLMHDRQHSELSLQDEQTFFNKWE